MGSSDKKSEKQPRPKGVSGYWDDTNTSPESETHITTAFEITKQLRDDPNAKTVIGPNTRHHDEVDQGTRPSYKEAERYSRNEPQKPSSPKPKERSKSPSRSEASKNSKCVSMRGVPLYPSATTKRYKLVL